jgi:hypothetical protein
MPNERIDAWVAGLEAFKANQGPARGTIAGALVILERLKNDFDLRIERHLAPKGTQVRGTSGTAIKKILARYGENRPYISEGGRTNRGLRANMETLLSALNEMHLEEMPRERRVAVLESFQARLVEEVRAFHNRQRLRLEFDSQKTTFQLVADLLASARASGKDGPLAQYLVGAKLQVRFPDVQVENHRATTADAQLGRIGDFSVGDTAFHVTVAPMPSVFDKCRRNLEEGLYAYLLVPHHKLEGARQIVPDELQGRVTVVAVESFVAQNIDEIGRFRAQERRNDFARLLRTYNERVGAIEHDKSLLIEIPRNLAT